MHPEWRSETVVLICKGMRESRDYSALPILADALEDAGCDNRDLLDNLRSLPTNDEYTELRQERLVAIAYSPESQEAVRWMHAWVIRINYGEYPKDYDWDKDDGVGVVKHEGDPHSYYSVMEMLHQCADEDDPAEMGMYFGTDDGADYFRGPDRDERLREFFGKFALISGRHVNNPEDCHVSCSC